MSDPPSLDRLSESVLRAIALKRVDADARVRLMAFVDGATRIDETRPVRTAIVVQEARERPSQRAGFHCRISSWHKTAGPFAAAHIKSTTTRWDAAAGVCMQRRDAYTFDLAVVKRLT